MQRCEGPKYCSNDQWWNLLRWWNNWLDARSSRGRRKPGPENGRRFFWFTVLRTPTSVFFCHWQDVQVQFLNQTYIWEINEAHTIGLVWCFSLFDFESWLWELCNHWNCDSGPCWGHAAKPRRLRQMPIENDWTCTRVDIEFIFIYWTAITVVIGMDLNLYNFALSVCCEPVWISPRNEELAEAYLGLQVETGVREAVLAALSCSYLLHTFEVGVPPEGCVPSWLMFTLMFTSGIV